MALIFQFISASVLILLWWCIFLSLSLFFLHFLWVSYHAKKKETSFVQVLIYSHFIPLHPRLSIVWRWPYHCLRRDPNHLAPRSIYKPNREIVIDGSQARWVGWIIPLASLMVNYFSTVSCHVLNWKKFVARWKYRILFVLFFLVDRFLNWKRS